MRTCTWIAALAAMLALLAGDGSCLADVRLVVADHAVAPVLDGIADDAAWARADGIIVQDPVADISIELKTIHSGQRIYFLARYPDPEPSVQHRSWEWNAEKGEYETGPDREDVFVMKWFLDGDDGDLSLSSPAPYSADVWFWKACRTNPAGYADDKHQILSDIPLEQALRLTSKTGSDVYLKRLGDEGSSAYKTAILLSYEGDVRPRFETREPTGSRADIRARGAWSDGYWTIEFARKLQTGHSDDVQFETDASYRFGISRYEVAGRQPEEGATQPLYGCGEIGEIITLIFGGSGQEQVQ